MPKRKSFMSGGAQGMRLQPRAVSNMMNRPAVPTPASTWERIKNFAKQHKVISRGLKAVSGMVGDKYSPIFNAGSSLAESYGYGRKRKGRKQKGGYRWGDPPNAPYMYDSPLRKKMRELNGQRGSGKLVSF